MLFSVLRAAAGTVRSSGLVQVLWHVVWQQRGALMHPWHVAAGAACSCCAVQRAVVWRLTKKLYNRTQL